MKKIIENKPLWVVEIEEWALEDSGRKYDLILRGRVVRVHRGRSHAPPGSIDGLVKLLHVVDEAVHAGLHVVAEVVVGID